MSTPAEKLHASVLRHHGKEAIFTPQGGEPTDPVKVTFKKGPERMSPTSGMYVSSAKVQIGVRLADLPQGLKRGDAVQVNGEGYYLKASPEPDENGWCVMELYVA